MSFVSQVALKMLHAMVGGKVSPNTSQDNSKSTTPAPGAASQTRSFLSPELTAHIHSQDTVTTTLAAHPDWSVQQTEEHLYGKRHHAHHKYEAAAEDSGEGLLEKLHLTRSKSKEEGSAETDKLAEDGHNRAMDQWSAIRPLSQAELDEVRRYGKWGTKSPSDLFLNVSWDRAQH